MPSVLLEWGDDLAVRATVHGDLRTSDLRILGRALLDASFGVRRFAQAGCGWDELIEDACATRARNEIAYAAETARLAVAYEESHPVECSCGARFRTEGGRTQHKRRSRVCAYLTAERMSSHA